jgi:hypothetical protein
MPFIGNTPARVPLTSADITDGIIVNADIATTAAIATSKLGAGAVLQVVSTTKTDVFTASLNNSFTDITGLSVSITPSSASNKILIISMINYGNNSVYPATLRLLRDSTHICAGPAASSRQSLTVAPQGKGDNDINRGMNNIITFLDSPSTTSSTTYKIQGGILQSSGTLSCNTTGNDLDANYMGRSASTIIVMEIKG